MVAAAREALASKSLDALTLEELTSRAGVTVGAFYQRFPSKATFIKYLEEEAYRDIQESSERLFATGPPKSDGSVLKYLRTFVSGMAALYQEHCGVLRELVQRSRSNAGQQQRRIAMTGAVVASAVDWILAQDVSIQHPDPHRALSIALLFTSSALRDVILFDETWADGEPGADVASLVEELVRAAAAYLGIPYE